MKFKRLLLVLALLGGWSVTAHALTIKPANNEKMCLTPALSYPLEKAMDNGSFIVLQPCDEFNPLMDFETFTVETNPPLTEIRTVVLSGGSVLCLQPIDGHPTKGAQLTARFCSGLTVQSWLATYNSAGAVTLQLVAEQPGGPPVCMDSAGRETKFGIQVQVAPCNGGPTQQFYM
jgi:hypothetical protein